ncbi:hypothetical protein ACFFOM_05990 [Microlunatus capsulatus]|uniref:DivIVA domain-containing protein n=1 Tax=Microlunatus capsulatus TaxID=99117 RepID=A0ABS4Z5G1_9ACTN|nr:hypothetical protein [Microlunatus capsulatus]MBP2416267.1 hypothetical protein [Microlunatus capsulatus]
MAGVAWVFVGAAAVATLVALLVFLVPLGRRGSESLGTRPAVDAGPGSPAGSLARGFSYLHVSPPPGVRRAGVHDRLARAFARVDSVDPHEAPRRIGEALLQAGLADGSAATRTTPSPAPAAPAPADPDRTRPDRGPAPHPREPA